MVILFAAALLAPLGQAVAEDDYLKALQQEAARTSQSAELKKEARPEPRPATSRSQFLDGELPPGLDMDAFEEALKSGFFGSYMFYQRLLEPAREAVHAEYLENPEGGIDTVRDAITRRGG